jgi:methylthioribose-1-phosphate isomerase
VSPESETLRWEGDARRGRVVLLDQTRLPRETVWLEVGSLESMVDAIRRLACAARRPSAWPPPTGWCSAAGRVRAATRTTSSGRAREAAARLAASRPTAVNCRRARRAACGARARGRGRARRTSLLAALLDEARPLEADEREACERMGAFGAELLADGMACSRTATRARCARSASARALAPLYVAARQGKRLRIFADETRPLFQGARLTAWELARAGLDVTVIADSAAGTCCARRVGAVLVGADRIARNGDVANKIGTYPLAVLARATACRSTSWPRSRPSIRAAPSGPRSRSRSARPRSHASPGGRGGAGRPCAPSTRPST